LRVAAALHCPVPGKQTTTGLCRPCRTAVPAEPERAVDRQLLLCIGVGWWLWTRRAVAGFRSTANRKCGGQGRKRAGDSGWRLGLAGMCRLLQVRRCDASIPMQIVRVPKQLRGVLFVGLRLLPDGRCCLSLLRYSSIPNGSCGRRRIARYSAQQSHNAAWHRAAACCAGYGATQRVAGGGVMSGIRLAIWQALKHGGCSHVLSTVKESKLAGKGVHGPPNSDVPASGKGT